MKKKQLNLMLRARMMATLAFKGLRITLFSGTPLPRIDFYSHVHVETSLLPLALLLLLSVVEEFTAHSSF